MFGTSGSTKVRRRTGLIWGLGVTLIAAMALSVGFFAMRSAHANTYNVCASGCTYTSIQTALNAASSGATITVGPGTYNETITITKSVTLEGANVGVDGTSGSRTAESIIDAGGSTNATVTVNASGAAVTIDGFEITGSHTKGLTVTNVGTFTAQNNVITGNYNGIFEMTGTTLLIQHNLIRNNTTLQYSGAYTCFSGHPYCNGIFEGATIGTLKILDNTIDETYTNLTDFIANFQRAMSISPNSSNSVSIEGNTIVGSTTLGNLTGDFSNNTYTGGLFALRLVGGVSNFTITDNQFSGLQSNAVITQNSYFSALNSNLTISNNTVTQDIGLLGAGMVVNGADVATFDLGYIGGTTTLTANRVTYSGTYTSGFGVSAVHAIRLRSTGTGTVNITYNTLTGGGVGGTGTNGIQIDSGAPIPTISNNVVRTFVDGVYDASAKTYTTGTNNCISGNSSYGYEATGGAVTAHTNWWGSALGPGTGIGYGNPVTTGTVDASSFLTTAPQSACAGPVASSLASTVSPLYTNAKYAMHANLATTTTSGGAVQSAYYTLDGGTPQAMTASSGTLGSSNTVTVTSGTLAAFSSPGTHTVCVFGTDAYGQTGSAACFKLSVTTAPASTTGNGRSGNGGTNNPQTAQAPGANGSTGSSNTQGNAHSPTNGQATAGVVNSQSSASFPMWLVALLIVLAFGLIGGGAVIFSRTRKTTSR